MARNCLAHPSVQDFKVKDGKQALSYAALIACHNYADASLIE
jgi:hypothetical protein